MGRWAAIRSKRFRRRLHAAWVAFEIAIVLAGLAGAWRLPLVAQTDFEASRALQRLQGPRANVSMSLLTGLGSGTVLWTVGLLAALVLARRGRPREAWAAGLSLLAMPLNVALKLIAARPRPGAPLAVITETYGTSFPSGHSMGSAAVYGVLAVIAWSLPATRRRAWVVGLVAVPFAVGVSRVFLGAHWGYDVVAGWAGGALVAAAVAWWLKAGSGKGE